MKRRKFLQEISCALAALGLAQEEWLSLGNPYYQALAQSKSPKLALLIGINEYSQSPALAGCVTDVELQRELLINRFGFAPADILTLTDKQATKDLITAAFVDHLSQQVKPEDVVIFHFSGYGTRVKTNDQIPDFFKKSGIYRTGILQNAILPVDENNLGDEKSVNYLLEETLLLLLQSLPTNQVIAVLDTSYYHPSELKSTGLQIRTRPELSSLISATEELEFLSHKNQKSPINNALIFKATSEPNQQAGELLFPGWSSGLFTYALTQYLWETTPQKTIQVLLSHVGSSIYKLAGKQQPSLLSARKNPENALITDYFPINNSRGVGIIKATEDDGKTIKLWLGGLPPLVLANYGVNSRLMVETGVELIIKSRTGLIAKAQVDKEIIKLPLGQIVQESVRALPRNTHLNMALDQGLERIERVDATSAFSGINNVVNIVTSTETADYVFGKVSQIPSRYGVFSLGGELITNTVGEIGEAVKVAVQRLTPKFSTLLASKLWQLTENEGTSRLPVRATLEVVNNILPRILMVRETVETANSDKTYPRPSYSPTAIPTISVGSLVQYRIENLSDRPVYLILVALNNNQSAFAFYPWQVFPPNNISPHKPQLTEILIPPGKTVKIPDNQPVPGWLVPTLSTFCQHQIIISTTPFKETLTALATAKYPTTDQQAISPLVNPLKVAQALLQDLHNSSKVKDDINPTTTDAYILDVNNWASLNFSFQVV
ncbi:caspase family protein [Dolichospermum circinale]|uniref:caspase family protein n=1 Tax=Dolichospermum circinale TaxID=109265 RepID=UPI00232EAA8F|nr:caspase family protein [Dolichospermum circinale]MDB9454933.1 caspase family protein [Dolichospermum circinale CS-541/06]MDB9464158.1 caspase family protein [Dolichospermum circinale CS-541/04]MDB9548350.1 caspase family protein [Dolichospermum circinale CS-1031]